MRKDSWNVAPRNQCSVSTLTSSHLQLRGPPAEVVGCRWGHQLCAVDETARGTFPHGLGKHLEPRLRKTKDDDKILADAGKSLTVICDSCDEGWQGGNSWHWARWQPWLILSPTPSSCGPPPATCTQRHSEEWSETAPAALPQHSSIQERRTTNKKSSIQARSTKRQRDIWKEPNFKEISDPNTPPKETLKIQNQSQMNWRELSWWEKVNRRGSNHSTGYKGLFCKHRADSC